MEGAVIIAEGQRGRERLYGADAAHYVRKYVCRFVLFAVRGIAENVIGIEGEQNRIAAVKVYVFFDPLKKGFYCVIIAQL